MALGRQIAPLDAETKFCEDLARTASGVIQMNAVDRILAVGAGRQDFSWVIDIGVIETDTANELYTFILQGSNSATFASGIVNLAMAQFGAAAVLVGAPSASTPIGRYVYGASNEPGLYDYKYVRLNLIIAGTIAAGGITFSSWLTRRHLGV